MNTPNAPVNNPLGALLWGAFRGIESQFHLIPVAGPATTTSEPNGTVTGALGFTQPGNLSLGYTIATGPGAGTVAINPDGTYSYTPTSSTATTDSFTITASDGIAATNQTVTITIPDVPTTPTASNQASAANGVVTGTLAAFDRANKPLTYTVTVNPAGGSVTVTGNTYTYTPTQAAELTAGNGGPASDSFTVTAGNGAYASTAGIVTVPVKAEQATVTATIPMGAYPEAAAAGAGGFLYVVTDDKIPGSSSSEPSTVTVFNTLTNKITTAIPVADGAGAITISPNGLGYISGFSVSVINTKTNTAVTTIPVDRGWVGAGVAATPDGTGVYASTRDSVSVIDTATNTVVDTVAASTPLNVAISPTTGLAYVREASGVGVIDATNTTNQIVANLPLFADGLAVSPNGKFVYLSQVDQVSVLNTATNTVTATIPVGNGAFADAAFSPDSSLAYVANSYDNTVSVIDTASNSVISTISVGNRPTGVAVSPDGTHLYVLNESSQDMSVISIG